MTGIALCFTETKSNSAISHQGFISPTVNVNFLLVLDSI